MNCDIRSLFLHGSVSRKITLITAISSLVTLVLLTSVMLWRDWSGFYDRKEEQLATMARLVGANATAAIEFMHFEDAQELVDSLGIENDVSLAVIYNANGEPMVTFSRSGAAPPFPIPDFRGSRKLRDELYYVHDIEEDGVLIGSVLVALAGSELKQHFLGSVVLAISLFLAGILLTLMLSSRLQSVITSPLQNLSALAQKVSKDQNYSRRALKEYDDEVGSLVESFNFMLDAVHRREQALSASHRDLERKVAERTAQLREAMEEAQSASRAKSEFLATMSHELRTPMNAILGLTSILKDSDLDKERRGYIKVIRESSDTLLGLVNNVLDYSKIESGKLELEQHPFELLGCIEGAMDLVCAQKSQKPVLLVSDIDPNLPSLVIGDVTRLRQILVNLIGNAMKFTDVGHVRVTAECLEGDEGWIRFSVADTGIGISKNRQNRLFKSFSQLDSSTTRKFGGTGLGLAITKRLTTALGGSIEVESELHQGSTFTVHLPLEASSDSEPVAGPPPWSLEGNPVIALLDFPEPAAASLQRLFLHWGGRVTENSSAEATLVLINQLDNEVVDPPAKIAACALPATVPQIVVSNAFNASAMQKHSNCQVVTVPVHLSKLRRVIRTALGGQQTFPPIRDDDGWDADFCAFVQTLRILLAEDNMVNQKVFQVMMGKLGLEVDMVFSGNEALLSVERQQYDIIFMDYQMPEMDGIEATRHIREQVGQNNQPWIIGFSANVQQECVRDMLACGMNDYIAKPIKLLDIRRSIARHVQERNKQSTNPSLPS
ncbi:MAG: response regulator [Verrucomicrobia bacterium]|nr:response regulator [Verrucomicrobiota bacterium]